MRHFVIFFCATITVAILPGHLLAQQYHFRLNLPSNISYTEIDSIYSAYYLFDTKPDPSTITNKTQIIDVDARKNQSGYLFLYTPSPKMFDKKMNVSEADLKTATVTYHLDPDGKLRSIELPEILEGQLKNLPANKATLFRNMLRARERTRYWFTIGQIIGRTARVGETWKDSVYIRQTTGDSVLYAQNITFSRGSGPRKPLIVHFTYIPNKNQYQKYYTKTADLVAHSKPVDTGNFRGQMIKGSVRLDPNTLKVYEFRFSNTIKSYEGTGNDRIKLSDVSRMHVIYKY